MVQPASQTSPATFVPSSLPARDVFHISPLIRITLLGLYTALMGPLPVLAWATAAPVSPWLLLMGIGLGALGIYIALAQQVETDEQGIRVTYPRWSRWLFRGGWQLPWQAIDALRPRSTGQGGLVYYFVGKTKEGSQPQQAYLLPMRVAGFARLVRQVEAHTGIDTTDVKPLAQPWMYGLLLLLTVFLLLIDLWVVTTALQMGGM
jgi:hypothetical protein